MIRNYLTIALRNIVRHKLYSFINIAGLTVGLTCAIFIILFVRDQLSYDRWIPGTENLEFHFNDPFDYSVTWDQSGKETLKAWGGSLTWSEQLAHSEFRSISAYRTHEYDSLFDTDFSPNQWINDGSPEEFEQVSQEFRLTSNPDSKLGWIVGLYYYHGNSLDLNFITFQQDILGFLGAPPGTPDLKSQAHGRQSGCAGSTVLTRLRRPLHSRTR